MLPVVRQFEECVDSHGSMNATASVRVTSRRTVLQSVRWLPVVGTEEAANDVGMHCVISSTTPEQELLSSHRRMGVRGALLRRVAKRQ